MLFFIGLTALSTFVSAVYSILPKPPVPLGGRTRSPSLPPSPYQGNATFQQFIDHTNPKLGTFSQRYWWSSEWWGGKGSPVVLYTPGESDASGYLGFLNNSTLPGRFAQEIHGAAVLLEHRYWGESSPYSSLTTETLQYLNLEQNIADLVHFAKTVKLPFDDADGSSNAEKAPWVLTGGSYSGALSAWTQSIFPGTFWAYHATSAPVQAIYNFWEYFVPIQEGMPKNCSMDVNRVVSYIDNVARSGDKKKQQELKEKFGLGDLEHLEDFAYAVSNPVSTWQSIEFTTGYSMFYEFCDAVENAKPGANPIPGPTGVGLERALEGYAAWFKSSFLPGSCQNYGYWTGNSSIACFDTYNASSPMYTDTAVNNAFNRQWNWLVCNEPLAYWQDADAPKSNPSLTSRLLNTDYFQRQCNLFFPEVNGYTYGSSQKRNKTVSNTNAWTKGWELTNTTRLMWTNGQHDPWRQATVSSTSRPSGPLQSTPQIPILMIPDGIHCSDLILDNAEANPGVRAVVEAEVKQVVEWVGEYYRR